MGLFIITILAILSLFGLTVFIGVDEATNYTLYGGYNEKGYQRVQEISEKYSYYHDANVFRSYYLEGDELKIIEIPAYIIPNNKFNIEESYYNDMSISYNIKMNRLGMPVYDEDNYLNIKLKPDYKIIKDPNVNITVNDLKTRRVLKNECVDDVKFKNGVFHFYVLKEHFETFKFKESPEFKLNFIEGDTKGKMACVNFNYQETFNHDIFTVNNSKSIHDVIISKDFDVKAITE